MYSIAMNVYKISYQAALDGEYRENVSHFDPWARYFDVRGASVKRDYGDSDLELCSDHLQNIVNLIYSGRKHGIDEIVLSLDQEDAKTQLWKHSYAVAFLPEVITEFEIEDDLSVLRVRFSMGLNTPGHAPQQSARTPSNRQRPKNDPTERVENDATLGGKTRDLSKVKASDIFTLTDDELDKLFDIAIADVKAERACRQSKGLPKNLESSLRDAVLSNSYHTVSLPTWVIDKYKLTGDDAKPGKKQADSCRKFAKIFEEIK